MEKFYINIWLNSERMAWESHIGKVISRKNDVHNNYETDYSAGDITLICPWSRHCLNTGHIIFCNNQVPYALSQHRDRVNVTNVSTEWVNHTWSYTFLQKVLGIFQIQLWNWCDNVGFQRYNTFTCRLPISSSVMMCPTSGILCLSGIMVVCRDWRFPICMLYDGDICVCVAIVILVFMEFIPTNFDKKCYQNMHTSWSMVEFIYLDSSPHLNCYINRQRWTADQLLQSWLQKLDSSACRKQANSRIYNWLDCVTLFTSIITHPLYIDYHIEYILRFTNIEILSEKLNDGTFWDCQPPCCLLLLWNCEVVMNCG